MKKSFIFFSIFFFIFNFLKVVLACETTGKTTKVVIVGGGPGGLTLANILEKECIPYIVIEQNKS